MSFLDTLKAFGTTIPTTEEATAMLYQSQPQPTPPDPMNYNWEWQRRYDALRSAATSAMSGYVSPYEGTGWGGNPLVMNNLERMFLAAAESKLDPMRMFTGEVTQLRTIGADQSKILRLFEAKLKESLTEKGKFGLNEMDIEGLQALTAGKNVLISAVKEQVAIQAKRAELKIKQQQASNVGTGGGGRISDNMSSSSQYGFGQNFMNNIFSEHLPEPSKLTVPAEVGTSMDLGEAGDLLDSLTNVSDSIIEESKGYTVKVDMEGDNVDTARFVKVDSDDNIIDVLDTDVSNLKYSPGDQVVYGQGEVPFKILGR